MSGGEQKCEIEVLSHKGRGPHNAFYVALAAQHVGVHFGLQMFLKT